MVNAVIGAPDERCGRYRRPDRGVEGGTEARFLSSTLDPFDPVDSVDSVDP